MPHCDLSNTTLERLRRRYFGREARRKPPTPPLGDNPAGIN
jgi:hypothetical protein